MIRLLFSTFILLMSLAPMSGWSSEAKMNKSCSEMLMSIIKENNNAFRSRIESIELTRFNKVGLSEFVGRPGHFGKNKKLLSRNFNEIFGEGNWKIVYKVGDDYISYEDALKLYEESYVDYLKNNPKILNYITTNGRDVYDTSPENVKSGLDYSAQDSGPTHLQDIAVRRALKSLGKKFEGDRLLEIRGQNSELFELNPGNIPFIDQDLILFDKVFMPRWVKHGSVEDFWQNNKFIVLTEKSYKESLNNFTELPAELHDNHEFKRAKSKILDIYGNMMFLKTKMNENVVNELIELKKKYIKNGSAYDYPTAFNEFLVEFSNVKIMQGDLISLENILKNFHRLILLSDNPELITMSDELDLIVKHLENNIGNSDIATALAIYILQNKIAGANFNVYERLIARLVSTGDLNSSVINLTLENFHYGDYISKMYDEEVFKKMISVYDRSTQLKLYEILNI